MRKAYLLGWCWCPAIVNAEKMAKLQATCLNQALSGGELKKKEKEISAKCVKRWPDKFMLYYTNWRCTGCLYWWTKEILSNVVNVLCWSYCLCKKSEKEISKLQVCRYLWKSSAKEIIKSQVFFYLLCHCCLWI